jgi:hypothetical protein
VIFIRLTFTDSMALEYPKGLNGVDNPAYLRWIGEEKNDPIPVLPLNLSD